MVGLCCLGGTSSNYGALVDELCTEETPLNPLNFLYGKTETAGRGAYLMMSPQTRRIVILVCDEHLAFRRVSARFAGERLRLHGADFAFTSWSTKRSSSERWSTFMT